MRSVVRRPFYPGLFQACVRIRKRRRAFEVLFLLFFFVVLLCCARQFKIYLRHQKEKQNKHE